MVATMTKLATSPVNAERPLANSRMMTSGFVNRRAKRIQPGEGFGAVASLGPQRERRRAASSEESPPSCAERLASTSAAGRRQNPSGADGQARLGGLGWNEGLGIP